MAPKRSCVKTRLLALACCCQQSVLLFGKTGYITNSSRRFQWNTVTDFRARLTGSQHPAGSRRFFIVLVLKFIWHKAQKLLDQKFLRGSEGLSSAQLWRESINPPTMAAQRCSSETSNLTVVTGANHCEKKNTIQPSFIYPIMSGLTASERGRQTDSTAWQALLSALLWARSSMDYHTPRHLFVERVNRTSSERFAYRRRKDDWGERWLRVSSEANRGWNFNLLKGLTADTLDGANLLLN